VNQGRAVGPERLVGDVHGALPWDCLPRDVGDAGHRGAEQVCDAVRQDGRGGELARVRSPQAGRGLEEDAVPPVRLAARPGRDQLLAGVPERPLCLDLCGEAGRMLADAGKHPVTVGSAGRTVDRLRAGRPVVERDAERRPPGLGRPVRNQVRAAADAHHRGQDETGNPEDSRLGDLERYVRLEAVGSAGRGQQRRDQRP
jgi:hypothetical protein